MMYSNVDGLSSKIQKLHQEIEIDKPDIVCITETKLEGETLDATLNLKGYQVWRRDRKGKKGGEIMILSKGKLLVHEFTPETSRAEMITIEIQLGGENILISTIY